MAQAPEVHLVREQIRFDLFGFYFGRFQIAGHVEPGDEMHVCHGSLAGEADARFLALFGRGGKLAAAVGNKRPRQLMATRKLLALGTSFQDAIEANP